MRWLLTIPRLPLAIALLAAPVCAQTFDCFGGLITDDHNHTAPVGPGDPDQQSAAFSRSGTTVTATVTNGAVYAIGEPMAAIGTGTALDWSNTVCAANLAQSQGGGLLITGIAGNTLTLSSPVSGTITSHSGTIKPLRTYWATVAGRVRFFTPLDHWIFGQDIDQASAPVIAKYGSNACNTAQDEYIALNSLGNGPGQGFNGIGHASAGQFYDGGSCPSNNRTPFFPEEGVFSYFGDNLKQNSFNGVAQPGKDMNWATDSNYSCQGVKRASLDTLDPLFESFVQGWIGGNNSDPTYFKSAFLKGITFQDSGNAMGAPTNSSWEWNTVPVGHNDCHQGLLLLATSPVQGGSANVLYGGTPNGPNAFPSSGYYLYPDNLNYLKGRNVLTTCDWSVSTLVCSLREYLQWKYSNSISSLNTAWSSSYSGFGSSGTAVTTETYGTGDGSTTSFSHNFASGNVDPNSVQIYLNGAQIGFDCPTGQASCPVSAGTGRFKGTNISGGTLTYSSGVSTLTFSVAPPNTQVISVNYVHGGWGEGGTGLMDEDGAHEGTNGVAPVALPTFQNSHAYALNDKISVSGSWQVVTTPGTSQSSSTPSWSSTAGVTTTTGTAIFTSEGAPVQGSGGSYTGSLPNANMGADLEAYEAYIGAAALSPLKTALQAVAPDTLNWCVDQLGVAFNPPAQGILQAASVYCDVAMTSLGNSTIDPLGPAKYTEYTKFFPGPISNYQAFVSDQGAFSANGNVPDFATRQQMGQAWYSLENYWLNQVGSNGTQQGANIQWTSNVDGLQSTNFGIETAATNPYNGHDNVTASAACLFNAFTCGGEASASWNGTDSITHAGCGSCIADATKLWVAGSTFTNGTAPRYQSTTSTANSGTITAPFNAASPVNAVGYDTSLNPAPMDAYTNLVTMTTFGGASVGNNSCGGGAFERMCSANNNRCFIAGSGGFAYAFELDLTGVTGQLKNTGALPTSDRIICPVATSFVNDNLAYNVVLNASPPYTAITSNNFPGNNTHTSTLLADLTSGTLCPGLPSGMPTHIGGFNVQLNDTRFSMNMSFTGGQDTDPWGVVWDKTLGCQVVNSVTGSYWLWNLAGTPSTPATGTLASASTCTGASDCNCWGGTIHNSQMSGDGTVLSFSMYVLGGNWTQGVCSAYSNAAQRSDYLIDSSITQWGHDSINPAKGAQYYDGHPAFGTSKVVGGDNNVATTHVLANIEGFTQWQSIPACATESHLSWPNPFGLDNYPAIFTSSDLPLSCGTNSAPLAFGNEMFAGYPGAVNQAFSRFGHTFSCNPANVLYPSCAGNSDFYFGCSNGIVTTTNDGNWAIVASGMLLGLGLDNAGKPFCGAALVHIGQQIFPQAMQFGIDPNSSTSYPSSISHDCVRIWDTPGAEWSFIQTVNTNTFSFVNLDNVLANAYSAGIRCAQIALARTPSFATSAPSDTSCGYYTAPGTAPGTSPGQCDPPSDLNADGTGANLFWRNWVAGLIAHVNAGCPGSGCYTNNHARLYIYETWNEPEACQFWNTPPGTPSCAPALSATGTGTWNQLARMEVDLYQIAKGLSGTNPFTGETNATAWATVTSVSVTGPLDPTSVILMPSVTPFAFTTAGQQFLYCNFAPVPVNCTLGGAQWTDGLNYHLKLGNASKNGVANDTPEAISTTWNTNIQNTLQTAEKTKPFYNTEGGAAVLGFVNCSTATGTAPPYCNFLDPDMQAGYVARNYLLQGCLGYANVVWYNWPAGLTGTTPPSAGASYNQIYNWMHGSSGLTCATSPPGTVKAGLFTYTASMTQTGGRLAAAVWDNSQDCNAGVCSTTTQTVPGTYTAYSDLAGNGPFTIFGGHVPVGVKPILLQGLPAFAVGIAITGSGTVTDNYGQITCPGTCSANYAQGSSVTLTAHPAVGQAFSSWAGCTSLTNSCTLTVGGASTVTGTFILGTPLPAPCKACFISEVYDPFQEWGGL